MWIDKSLRRIANKIYRTENVKIKSNHLLPHNESRLKLHHCISYCIISVWIGTIQPNSNDLCLLHQHFVLQVLKTCLGEDIKATSVTNSTDLAY